MALETSQENQSRKGCIGFVQYNENTFSSCGHTPKCYTWKIANEIAIPDDKEYVNVSNKTEENRKRFMFSKKE